MATPAFVEHGGLRGPAEKGGKDTEGMAGSAALM